MPSSAWWCWDTRSCTVHNDRCRCSPFVNRSNIPMPSHRLALALFWLTGYKLFPSFPSTATRSFKFVSMILQCTGGGILVPIFINSIPVPLSTDLYPIAIFAAYCLHEYLPILREVVSLSPILKASLLFLYETMRASVVVKLTGAAGKAIEPSDFSIAVFGPIFCGTVAGCGGAFLPLSKGLDPIKELGLGQPMVSALAGATFYHLFTRTSLSEGVVEPALKAHVLVAYFFIAHNIYTTFFLDAGHSMSPATASSSTSSSSFAVKAESKKSK